MMVKSVRNTTSKKSVRKKTTKKVASKVVPAKKLVRKTVARKAPTPIATQRANGVARNRLVLFGIIGLMFVIGGSVVIGVQGDGEISIKDRIIDVKENATPEERTIIDSIPVQKTKLRDGGLVPSGVLDAPPPVVEPLATSTSLAASSTEVITSEPSDETADLPVVASDTASGSPDEAL